MSSTPTDSKTNAQISMYDGPPYEFTEPQNRVIGDLSNSLRWVSIPALALSSITLAYLIIGSILGFRKGLLTDWHYISLLLYLLVNFIIFFSLFRWTMTASAGFQAIVDTKGKDIPFLMASLDNLGAIFGLFATFIKVFLFLTLLGLILSLVQLYSGDETTPGNAPPKKESVDHKTTNTSANKPNKETPKEPAKDAPRETPKTPSETKKPE